VREAMLKVLWLGHASFRLETPCGKVLYIDPWFQNPVCPLKETPTDADFVFVTHGHFDHISSVPELMEKCPQAKLVCSGEMHTFFMQVHKIPDARMHRMNKSGHVDFSFGRVSMVQADHSSSCGMHDGVFWDGGNAVGFVLKINNSRTVYHSGDTGIFGDMGLINELHKPDVLLICTGGNFTMGPEEASLAINKFFKSAEVVIPMHFKTFPPLLPDTFPQLKEGLANAGWSGRLVDSYEEVLGKTIEL